MLISQLSGGGAERIFCEMANFWCNRGCDVSIITLAGQRENSDNFGHNYSVSESVRVIELDLLSESRCLRDRLLSNWKRIAAIRSALSQTQPECLVSFMTGPNILAILASGFTGVPLVVSERIDPLADQAQGRCWRLLRKLLYRFAGAVVAQTRTAGDWLDAECRVASIVIPNHLRQLPVCERRREDLILSVGRLDRTRQKGFDLLLEAFARISKEYSSWNMAIVGRMPDGVEKDQLHSIVGENGLEGRVLFVGPVNGIEEWYARAGLVVQYSRYEGFPNVVLEAMGMGAPVISSDCRSGPADIITDGEDGRLVPSDSVDELVVSMRSLLDDPSKRMQLGERAAEVKEKYGIERMMGQWEDLINKVIGSKKKGVLCAE